MILLFSIASYIALEVTRLSEYDETDESRVVSYDLEASYHLTKNWAISAFGSYALDGQAKYDTEIHDKTIGLRLRTSF